MTGFTEANKEIEVAAHESGLLAVLAVKEGDFVEAEAIVAELDKDVQLAQLAIAEHLLSASGEIQKAKAELQTKQSIYRHFQQMAAEGFAQNKELLRAKMDVEVSRSALLVNEEKSTEYARRLDLARVQLKRRDIRTPIAGYVSVVHRRKGEFVSIANPAVVTIVQTNPMKASFQVALSDLARIKPDGKVIVRFGRRKVAGSIQKMGLVATSETVAVTVALPNDDGYLKIGQKCTLVLPTPGQLTSHSN